MTAIPDYCAVSSVVRAERNHGEQGFGYLLAGVRPFVFGLLHDVTDGWTVPWIFVLVIYVLRMTMGALAGRNRYV